jgi:cobaltochelatase CobN
LNNQHLLVLSQTDTDLLALEHARAQLPPTFAPLQLAHVGRLTDASAVDQLFDTLLPQVAVVICRLHCTRSFRYGLERLQQWVATTGGWLIAIAAVENADPDATLASKGDLQIAQLMSAYFQAGGPANLANGLRYLSDQLLATSWGYQPPSILPMHGVYYTTPPCADTATAPPVGVLFYRAHLLSGNTAFVDAIIAEIERQGLSARAIFTQSLRTASPVPEALELLNTAGQAAALINTLSFAIGDREPHPFADLDIPVIQAIISSSSRDQWLDQPRGLNPLDTAMNVAIPEFDGAIIGVPLTFKEQSDNRPAYYVADHERIQRVVGLARRLIALRHKPNSAKRVAFVLTNSSAKAQRIGNAVGLDAPASLLRLLQVLRTAGYTVGDLPVSSDQLIADLIERGSYDETWLTSTQLAQAFQVSAAQYAGWFAELPRALQDAMVAQWGAAPGTAYRSGDNLALAGLTFGQMLVVLQPPRGYDLDPHAIYHQPDLPPSHHYYALYRWLRDSWHADVIVHLGKHGTLEWLPGKSVGLSETCFPDQFLGDLPLIYPFIINDPGEGTQAKRRAHAVIIDHMTPPMTSAGAYGDLATLAQLVDEYYRTEQLDPQKLPLLQRQIWDVLQHSRLDDDLGYVWSADSGEPSTTTAADVPPALTALAGRDLAHLLEDIEGYVCELACAQIRDGLHILGSVPNDDQLIELVYLLLRLPNGSIPSLPTSVAHALGEDWQALLQQPGRRRLRPQIGALHAAHHHSGAICGGHGRRVVDLQPRPNQAQLYTNADKIQQIEQLCKQLLTDLATYEWDVHKLPQVIATYFSLEQPEHHALIDPIIAVLTVACTSLIPNLHRGANDEIEHLLAALAGRFVPPGPSGAPTRGMIHVLPTGRNFYSIDPRALPSLAAWHTGQGLAMDLIRRYQDEHGTYPESVGISIWGTSAMRTAGDDVAQVLALLGVRPCWQPENRRVIGVEVIDLAELGRPRIDVVCRISGFFRDAFPHLIALIDHAIQLVVARDEPPDQNFVRKHTGATAATLCLSGKSSEAAKREALYRVFGSAPGNYGAGILPLIDAQNWEHADDFAKVYLTWGGYAYTASEQGAPAQAAFATALAGVQVATKNQDTREHDIFDSDDYLQFHGGMIATIRTLTGSHPARYVGDSSDPARPVTYDLREAARRVFRSRVINPKWLASMERHGYKGGLELAATVDYLFGYDATADILNDWMYEQLTTAYIRDPQLQAWLEQANPWALQAIAERLNEAQQRGMWSEPSLEAQAALQAILDRGEEWREGLSRPGQTANAPDRLQVMP